MRPTVEGCGTYAEAAQARNRATNSMLLDSTAAGAGGPQPATWA
ncbi:hypothetical protein ABT275_33500 [Streptomyces sp. NPDC001185]